ncbi:MAG TPA: low affinity iron permease family protein [Polyangiaceae bacterium]|nr:low affinity iron permease family protein [Polyangiaceae bacterium]
MKHRQTDRRDSATSSGGHEGAPSSAFSAEVPRWRLGESFHRVAVGASQKMGSPRSFIAAVSLVTGWALTGPLFDFGDSWQLVINTSTTIITFLMVFLIQSSQNRDARALHLKLDELIRTSRARNAFADLEHASEEELDAFQEEFRQLRSCGVKGPDAAVQARERIQRRRSS